MYKFSRVSNFANLALRTYLHVLLLTYLQRGHSVESAEKRIFKIGQLGADFGTSNLFACTTFNVFTKRTFC